MEKTNVFEFEDYRSFLRAKVDEVIYSPSGMKRGNLERLAQKLGYKSPSSLSMILKGERIPSDNLVNELMEYWGLVAAEKEYFRTLVQLEKVRKKGKDCAPLIARLKKMNKRGESFQFSEQEFQHIRAWHYLVIKELAYTPDFQEDPAWIAKKLRKKITPSEAKEALEVLERLNILKRGADGKLRPAVAFTETSHDVPSFAIRQHHKGMLLRATEALEEQTPAKRHFGSLTLRIDPKKIPAIKEQLIQFLKNFHFDHEDPNANAVYQLSLQLFEHTREMENGRTNEIQH